jgi:hypothetical protein
VSITIGDIEGYVREDEKTGYTIQENTISVNSWWQSNNLGARLRRETPVSISPGDLRVLVFGDSFAHGTGVIQEDSWPDIIDAQESGLDVVNLAVPGYGMGQAALRFMGIRDHIDYDVVLNMFVPGADLWRDINVLRHLGEEGWSLYLLLPRFSLVGDDLTLIRSPYESRSSFIADNNMALSQKTEEHLSAYDRFFFPAKFKEPDALLAKTIIWRLATKVYYDRKRRSIRIALTDPASEAMKITKEIFEMMGHYAESDGKTFILVLLPSPPELRLLRRDSKFQQEWNRMSSALCETAKLCIDLGDGMRKLPESLIDSSSDGGHYGPKTNMWIANTIAKKLHGFKKPGN